VTNRLARSVATFVATLALATTSLLAATPSPVSAYPADTVTLSGHGWGHGRGMGQFGSLGYALNFGWDWTRILDHYYGGTTLADLEDGDNFGMTVRIMDRNNTDTVLVGPLTIDNVGSYDAAIIRRTGTNLWNVIPGTGASGCGGPWSPTAIPVSAESVRVRPNGGGSLRICITNGYKDVRGTVRADTISGQQVTINELPMGEYLKGVVPRESPASWGNLGPNREGMHALRAQSVAARSYAASENRYPGVAKTCDTDSCQVYGGISWNGAGEAANTNQAIAGTAGKVRRHANGAIARTEFSSSTGGWSAGGTFPAVEDRGDSVSQNPNHNWTASIPVSAIEARYGRGTLSTIQVLERNGLGADGGRVRRLRLVFSGGDVEVTGDQFRQAFALKSDWFTVTNSGAFPYHVATRAGGVYSFNGAQYHGSTAQMGIRTPIRDITEGPPGRGYWLLGEDGGVFSFNVDYHGSMGGQRLNSGVVGMEATASRQGYWLVAGDGGIFSFGDARFFGSTGAMRLNAPVVGMSPTPDGGGYWLVATDGGIFTFGNAAFFGSTGNIRLNQPVFAMTATPSGNGYWLVARDGGIFTFGDAAFHGSLPGRGVRETAVEILPSPTGGGYLIVTAEGNVYGFGDAPPAGGPKQHGSTSPAVGAGRVPQ
jgi:SpoIID/LytB domain protein